MVVNIRVHKCLECVCGWSGISLDCLFHENSLYCPCCKTEIMGGYYAHELDDYQKLKPINTGGVDGQQNI